jgi:mannose-6-phosphate isomerase-like protein (cupin superfamily)
MQLTNLSQLPGSDRSRVFEGSGHGATVTLFSIDYPEPGLGPGLHRHPYDETWLILEGRALLHVDGEEHEGGPGDIAVAPAHAPHKFTSLTPLRVVCVHASPVRIQDDLEP